MFTKIENVQVLNKQEQKEISGGNFFTCYDNCYEQGVQDGDCCIYRGTSPSDPDGLGYCQGFQCYPL
jgi:hypothetical protein